MPKQVKTPEIERPGLYICPKCTKVALSVKLEGVGGCTGHDEGEYCYCELPGVKLEFACRQCWFSVRVLEDTYEVERLLRDYLNNEGWDYLAKRAKLK